MSQSNLTAQKRKQKAEGKNHKKVVSTITTTRLAGENLGSIPATRLQ